MPKFISNGGFTVVRKVKKNGRAKGVMKRDNLEEAFNRGRGNVMILSTILGDAKTSKA